MSREYGKIIWKEDWLRILFGGSYNYHTFKCNSCGINYMGDGGDDSQCPKCNTENEPICFVLRDSGGMLPFIMIVIVVIGIILSKIF